MEVEAPFSATDQFDPAGRVFRLLTNFAEAEREYARSSSSSTARLVTD
jgi:hypothetical protein